MVISWRTIQGDQKMTKKLAIIVSCCTMIFLIGISPGLGQKNEVDLQGRRITIQMEMQALGTVFAYLMKKYEIPIGFEESILDRGHSDYYFWTNLPCIGVDTNKSANGVSKNETSEQGFFETKHPITVRISNGKLSDVLDQIVEQMKNYKWEINDGVVNIFPLRGRDERFKDLLETNIASYSLADGKTVDDISRSILKLPEFGRWSSKNKLEFLPLRSGVVYILNQQYGRRLDNSMSFSNLRFRKLLNEVTKIKKGGWILKWNGFSANGEERIDLDI